MLRFENLSKRYSERLIFQGLHYDTAFTQACEARTLSFADLGMRG